MGRVFASATVGLVCWAGAEARLTDFVDPLIGTVGPTPGSTIAGGNSFPGAAVPWGMVKAGIDTSYLGLPEGLGNDCNAGYSPIGNVTAVSLTHVSGTGGVPTYGLISQMPLLGSLDGINLGDNTTYWQNRTLDQETASVGHFSTTLLNGIKIDITSSNHTALIRYTFPSASPSSPNTAAHILIDLTHVLPAWDADAQSYSQKFHSGLLHIDSSSSSYSGTASYTGGWSQPDIHTLHFCGNFSTPAGAALTPLAAGSISWPYDPSIPPADPPVVRPYRDVHASAGAGMGIGALFSWAWDGGVGAGNGSEAVLEARVGISYQSRARACRYVEEEVPAERGLEEVVERARGEWEEKVLGNVVVEEGGDDAGGNKTLMRMLYSALYQTALMPTDKTGENPWWGPGPAEAEEPYFDDHYTLWDTYRTALPLYHLLYTPTYTRILKGLLNIFRHEGYLPAGRTANWNGRVQGGTHADTVLADAFVKSVRTLPSSPTNASTVTHGLNELALSAADWATAYAALAKDASVPPIHNADPVAPDGATKEGRGALAEWRRLGFLTRNHTRSLSRGVEYAQNDFAVWSVAVGLAALNDSAVVVDADDAATWRARADWWQGQWNPGANASLEGVGAFRGFVGARDADGKWNLSDYDPRSCGKCGWASDIYEAKVWETSFAAAPHDMAKVVELMGGDEAFLARLDASFLPGFGTSVGANNDAGSALFNPGNEPSFATPFLYNYVPGNQWKTVNQSRAIVDTFYSDARNGYPGNIDSGALPSWLIFNLIGLYPIAGQPLYLIGTPRFSSLTLRLFAGTPHGTSLQITAVNMTDTSFYPQRVTLNGLALDRAWVSHAEIAKGGKLVFEMGAEPAQWDVGERPWSLSPW
ncbi:putative glycosidase [Diplodia seriata]|uniref:Putative glycosidase n=1 Tax=Diplodia seriata TaxID=420778 RepID=A0A1S8BCS7_9PEZI|nr:putative glycosidase [Diplodia seriata]